MGLLSEVVGNEEKVLVDLFGLWTALVVELLAVDVQVWEGFALQDSILC